MGTEPVFETAVPQDFAPDKSISNIIDRTREVFINLHRLCTVSGVEAFAFYQGILHSSIGRLAFRLCGPKIGQLTSRKSKPYYRIVSGIEKVELVMNQRREIPLLIG